jgi:hypothetical protein
LVVSHFSGLKLRLAKRKRKKIHFNKKKRKIEMERLKMASTGSSTDEGGVVLTGLPPEVLECIFSYLSARDLARASLVCSQFSATASENKLWRDLYCHVFDISLQQCLPSIASPPGHHGSTTAPPQPQQASLLPPASVVSSSQSLDPASSAPSSLMEGHIAPPPETSSSTPHSTGDGTREEVVLISNVKLCFSDATHVSVARERDWRGLFAVRYEVEKKHCISFLQREREQIKRRKLERNVARGKAAPDTAANEVTRPACAYAYACACACACVACRVS